MGKADRRNSRKMRRRRSRAKLKARKRRNDGIKKTARSQGSSQAEASE